MRHFRKRLDFGKIINLSKILISVNFSKKKKKEQIHEILHVILKASQASELLSKSLFRRLRPQLSNRALCLHTQSPRFLLQHRKTKQLIQNNAWHVVDILSLAE